MLVITPIAKNGNQSPFCEVRSVPYHGNCNELRNTVDCDWLEAVHIGDGLDLWFDEEGRLDGKPFNQMATRLYGKDTIVGTACVLSHDGEGNEVDLTEEQKSRVLSWLGLDGTGVAA